MQKVSVRTNLLLLTTMTILIIAVSVLAFQTTSIQAEPTKELVASSIRLVDGQGRDRIVMIADGKVPAIEFFDSSGNSVISIQVIEDGSLSSSIVKLENNNSSLQILSNDASSVIDISNTKYGQHINIGSKASQDQSLQIYSAGNGALRIRSFNPYTREFEILFESSRFERITELKK